MKKKLNKEIKKIEKNKRERGQFFFFWVDAWVRGGVDRGGCERESSGGIWVNLSGDKDEADCQ